MYNEHTSPLFKKLNIIKFKDIFNVQLCKLIYKCINNLAPPSLSTLFTRNTDIHGYLTRNRNCPRSVKPISTTISRNFIHRGPIIWAQVPESIRDIYAIKPFLYKLKSISYPNTRNLHPSTIYLRHHPLSRIIIYSRRI